MNIDKAHAFALGWNEHVKAKRLAIALPGPAPKAKMSSVGVSEGPDFGQGMAGGTEFVASGPFIDETHWWKAYAEHSAVDGRLHRAAVEDGAVRDTAARRALPTPETELQSAPAAVVHRTRAQGCAKPPSPVAFGMLDLVESELPVQADGGDQQDAVRGSC